MKDWITCNADKGYLVICLSAECIKFSTEEHEEFFDSDGDKTLKVTDQIKLAKAVAHEMTKEEEDGTTLIHTMLDKAIFNAVENGCDGVEAIAK